VALANGIQRYLRKNNRPEITFMQKNSPVFPLFLKGIDAKMKELRQTGIGKFFICIIQQIVGIPMYELCPSSSRFNFILM
jgi:hypothetical protein